MRKKGERFLYSADPLDPVSTSEGLVYQNLTRKELRDLADRVSENDSASIEFATRFFAVETRGTWHNRARAMLARRFKHCDLADRQKHRVLNAIFRRLQEGAFFEQFKDQLRFALYTDPDRTIHEAESAINRPVPRIIQYPRWILKHRTKPANQTQ